MLIGGSQGRHHASGGNRPSKSRFSRNITRTESLIFSTCTVTIPALVLPTKVVWSQGKCGLQFCFGGLKSGYNLPPDSPARFGPLAQLHCAQEKQNFAGSSVP